MRLRAGVGARLTSWVTAVPLRRRRGVARRRRRAIAIGADLPPKRDRFLRRLSREGERLLDANQLARIETCRVRRLADFLQRPIQLLLGFLELGSKRLSG